MKPGKPKIRLLFLLLGGLALVFGSLWLAGKPGPVLKVSIGPYRVKPQIAIQWHHVMILAPDGSLWLWGADGPNADASYAQRWMKPQRLGKESDWSAIALGTGHALALKTNGTLWQWTAKVWPWTAKGMDSFFRAEPQQVTEATDWSAIAASSDNVVAISTAVKSDGSLWVWGKGGSFQLPSLPTRIGSETNWIAVGAWRAEVVGLMRDHTLWKWHTSTLIQNPSLSKWRDIIIQKNQPKRWGEEASWAGVQVSDDLVARKLDGSYWLERYDVLESPPYTRYVPIYVPIRGTEGMDSLVLLNPYAQGLGIKRDGSAWKFLWTSTLDGARVKSLETSKWAQIGDRHDWVTIAGLGQTKVGLTRDGGVWAWGRRLDKPFGDAPWRMRLAIWCSRLGLPYRWAGPRDPIMSANPELVLKFNAKGARPGAAPSK